MSRYARLAHDFAYDPVIPFCEDKRYWLVLDRVLLLYWQNLLTYMWSRFAGQSKCHETLGPGKALCNHG